MHSYREFYNAVAHIESLNPCFNGRCTRTGFTMSEALKCACLNPCFNGRCTRTTERGKKILELRKVLILVLMEDALVHFFNVY